MQGMFDKFPLAASGWPYVLGALFLAVCASVIDVWILAIPLWLAFMVITYFFRDPTRICAEDPALVISPADGHVVAVEMVEVPELPGGRGTVVSIFMSILNVHVNRSPIKGEVLSLNHTPGGFTAANNPSARTGNERLVMVLGAKDGKSLAIAQVAGLIARRIECQASPGDTLERGQRYGMIRFGSRLDVYFPQGSKISASLGQKVTAGITPIGVL
jgi:phosphatidylserine decarboxylase